MKMKRYENYHMDSNESCVITVKNLIKELKISVNNSTIERVLKDHPDFPSLAAINDSLNEWEIETMPIKITSEKLHKVPFPSLAHLHNNGGEFIVLSELKNENVRYIDPYKGWVTEHLNEFTTKWTGVILAVEASETSGERDFLIRQRKEKLKFIRRIALIVFIAVLVISIFVTFSKDNRIIISTLFLIKLIGSVLVGSIINQELTNSNFFFAKLCKLHRKFNCNDVFNSSASTIFKTIKVSDLGFLYFFGGILSLLFLAVFSASKPVEDIFAILNFLALPYTLFSIYYQARVLKSYCLMCISVQILLWVELFILYTTWPVELSSITFLSVNLTLVGFLIATLLLLLLKPLLVSQQQNHFLRKQLYSFKRNPDILRSLLQRKFTIQIEYLSSEIILGNSNSTSSILVVFSPFCNACANYFKELEELLNDSGQHFKLLIRFVIDESNEAQEFIRHILFLNNCNKSKMIHALSYWYRFSKMNLNSWKKQFPITTESQSDLTKLILEHIKGTSSLPISIVPSIFINMFPLPKEYQVGDLKFIIKTFNKQISIQSPYTSDVLNQF